MLGYRSSAADNKLLVRCTVADVVSGACSLEALRAALQAGFSVRISTALHVKLYVFDDVLYVGSANLTGKGLALFGYCNDELSTEGVPTDSDIDIAENLWNQGAVLDATTLQKMMDFAGQLGSQDAKEFPDWPAEILMEFRDLYCSDFPQGTSADKERWASLAQLEASAAYKWLVETVTNNGGSASFGYLSSNLHSTVYDDPAPYRRQIKDLLANLLSLVEEYDCPELIIERPNHSSVVFLRDTPADN